MPSPQATHCPNCQKLYFIDADLPDRSVKCNACQHRFLLPAPSKAISDSLSQAAAARGRIESSRQPRRKPAPKGSRSPLLLSLVLLLALVSGGVFYVYSRAGLEKIPSHVNANKVGSSHTPSSLHDRVTEMDTLSSGSAEHSEDTPPHGTVAEASSLNASGSHLDASPDYSSHSLFDGSRSGFLEVDEWAQSSDYDSTNKKGVNPTRIKGDYWVRYSEFDFGEGATYLKFEMNSFLAKVDFEVRLDSLEGASIASYSITPNGQKWEVRGCPLSKTVSGIKDVYFVFNQKEGYEYGIRGFMFRSVAPGLNMAGSRYNSKDFDGESHPNRTPVVAEADALAKLRNGAWVGYKDFDFGDKANRISIEAATPKAGGRIELRIDSLSGPPIAVINVRHTGSWTHFMEFETTLSSEISGTHHLFLKFVDTLKNPDLFKTRNIYVSKEEPPVKTQLHRKDQLHVYDPVPGLSASPYYAFSVQKVSELNAANPEDATNWETPFAWFTRCVDKKNPPPASTAYFRDFIGSWSHTYCNFEMGPDTPIVVKIKRLDKDGAPSGPITSAVPHPARHVQSCKIINGEVYVTMPHPALVAIDIDGQMDSRDAPRAKPFPDWGWGTFPYANEKDATHAVTIFANPFIDDKPNLDDPSVYAVEPGTLPPTDGPWTTLYFKPGIHKMSVDENGNERDWRPPTDVIKLLSGKQYYIPGDAILYGNFNDYNSGGSTENVRLFGHGTISGTKIAHWQDWSDEFKANKIEGVDRYKSLRVLEINGAKNCVFEGLTVADPAEHGFYMFGSSGNFKPNYIRWVKTISWRVNNDAGGISGNTYIEDCFLRHQDDGLYLDNMRGIRRIVLWSDVNGCPLRLSFILRAARNMTEGFPQHLIVEDIDIIYSRMAFGSSSGIMESVGFEQAKYSDGTPNSGQHLVFRNLRVSDPRPQRVLFEVGAGPKNRPLKGLTFENVNVEFPHTWGSSSRLKGKETSPFQYWVFDDVFFAGEKVDQAYLNSDKITTSHVRDAIIPSP
jgi:hypothetical protein